MRVQDIRNYRKKTVEFEELVRKEGYFSIKGIETGSGTSQEVSIVFKVEDDGMSLTRSFSSPIIFKDSQLSKLTSWLVERGYGEKG